MSILLLSVLKHVFNIFLRSLRKYHNNPRYWDRQAQANSVDPDQMASDQGLHCLQSSSNILDTSVGSKNDF